MYHYKYLAIGGTVSGLFVNEFRFMELRGGGSQW